MPAAANLLEIHVVNLLMAAIKALISRAITAVEAETTLAEATPLKANAEAVAVNSVAKEIAIAHVEMRVQLQTVALQAVEEVTDLIAFQIVHKEAAMHAHLVNSAEAVVATHVLPVVVNSVEAVAATHVLLAVVVNSVVNAAAAIRAILVRLAIFVATAAANPVVKLPVNRF